MTFKLNPELRIIIAPIILAINGKEHRYPNGESLIALGFEKRFVINSISARDGEVVVSL